MRQRRVSIGIPDLKSNRLPCTTQRTNASTQTLFTVPTTTDAITAPFATVESDAHDTIRVLMPTLSNKQSMGSTQFSQQSGTKVRLRVDPRSLDFKMDSLLVSCSKIGRGQAICVQMGCTEASRECGSNKEAIR